MPDVKPVVRTTLRAERAAVTRDRIAQTARTLFSEQGYGATTLTAIAAEAGVAVQTVYAVYGSKAGILRALTGKVLRQPEAESLYEQALAVSSADEALGLFARSIRHRWEYGYDVVVIGGEAASTDPVLRLEVQHIVSIRRAGLARLAGSLAAGLAPGIDVARAVALIDAVTLPNIYGELVAIHGWTPDDYETWLAVTLRHQLLDR